MKRAISLIFALLLFFTLALNAEAKIGFSHGERAGKKIALSFDDGPHPTFTPKILSLLEKYGIKATFS